MDDIPQSLFLRISFHLLDEHRARRLHDVERGVQFMRDRLVEPQVDSLQGLLLLESLEAG